jgi:hypothetical protein
VLHDEDCSCGDWPDEISQHQVGRKSVAHVSEVMKAEQTNVSDLDAQADEALEAARKLPHGPARFEAMRKARQLRLVATRGGEGADAVSPPPNVARLRNVRLASATTYASLIRGWAIGISVPAR